MAGFSLDLTRLSATFEAKDEQEEEKVISEVARRLGEVGFVF